MEKNRIDMNKDITTIYRQAAIDGIAKLLAYHGSEGVWIDQKEALDVLRSLPSAQLERKTGKWIPINGAYQWKCSNCGEYICGDADCTPYINHYCWNCGADMGGEED